MLQIIKVLIYVTYNAYLRHNNLWRGADKLSCFLKLFFEHTNIEPKHKNTQLHNDTSEGKITNWNDI